MHALEENLKAAQNENISLNESLSQLRKDQEDLLMLLADQETQIETYKMKLRQLGHPVSNNFKKLTCLKTDFY